MKRHKGFTLLELLIVIGMIAMLATLVIPTLSRAKDLVKRTKCASNIKAIGHALVTAAAESGNGRLPSIRTGQNTWNRIGHHKTTSYDPTTVGGFPAQDGTRPLFGLMVRTRETAAGVWVRERVDMVKPDVFLCPAVSHTRTRIDLAEWQTGVIEQVGFESAASCHYAYQHSINADNIPVLSTIDDSKRIILADRSPYVKYASGIPTADSFDTLGENVLTGDDSVDEGLLKAQSNHKMEGHNVLRLGGDVRWSADIDMTVDGDNIWQATLGGAPVPVRADAGPDFDPITREPEIFLVP